MELWIRSQDKEKILPIDKPIVYDFSEFGNHRIIYKESASYVMELGLYKSKERALEVLDEIQEVLCPKVLIMKPNSQITISDNANLVLPNNCSYGRIGDTYVYEMPEE